MDPHRSDPGEEHPATYSTFDPSQSAPLSVAFDGSTRRPSSRMEYPSPGHTPHTDFRNLPNHVVDPALSQGDDYSGSTFQGYPPEPPSYGFYQGVSQSPGVYVPHGYNSQPMLQGHPIQDWEMERQGQNFDSQPWPDNGYYQPAASGLDSHPAPQMLAQYSPELRSVAGTMAAFNQAGLYQDPGRATSQQSQDAVENMTGTFELEIGDGLLGIEAGTDQDKEKKSRRPRMTYKSPFDIDLKPNEETGRYFDSFDDAKRFANVCKLHVPQPDSIPRTKEEKGVYVDQLVAAMTNIVGVMEKPTNPTFRTHWLPKSDGSTYYKPWTIEYKAWELLVSIRIFSYFRAVIAGMNGEEYIMEIHSTGWSNPILDDEVWKTIKRAEGDTFKERMEKLIKLLTYSKTTCMNLLRREKTWFIIGAPDEMLEKVEENKVTNDKRAELIKSGKEANNKKAAEDGKPLRRKAEEDDVEAPSPKKAKPALGRGPKGVQASAALGLSGDDSS